MKKLFAVLICVAMLAMLFAGCELTQTGAQNGSQTTDQSGTNDTAAQQSGDSGESSEAMFASGDEKDVSSETPNATITLCGTEGTISDETRGSSGSTVTITSKGVYLVTGSSTDVTIRIADEQESGNIYLILDNVSMTNSVSACIYVESADKVILQCVGSSSLSCTASSNADGIDGAIYAKDDLTINGSGSLSVTSTQHGIVCKDDLKMTGASITVTASSIGLQAGDSVRIADSAVSVTSGHDGIQIENSDGSSFFYMESGTLSVAAGYDAIDVDTSGSSFSGSLTLCGGTISLTAGGGAGNSKDSSISQKGLACEGNISISGCTLTVSSADDAVHSNGSITVSSGTVTVSSSDDGITATDTLSIQGGTITVEKSYEGLEAETVDISSGTISVCAGDDGVNAAGGSDTGANDWNPWGSGSSSGTLTISGGTLYVNAGGDGLDSNGSIYITGGFTIIEGPTDNGNGALDKGDSNACVASITGGTVLALGTTGMAVNFDTGTQCSALVTLSGSAGTTVTVDDGSGFSFTASKSFQCAVYSSPYLQKGSSYTITADSSSAVMDFSSSLYYSTVGGMGGFGGMGPGRR